MSVILSRFLLSAYQSLDINTHNTTTIEMSGNGNQQAEDVVAKVLTFTSQLSQFTSFQPSPELDKVLGSISYLCHKTEVSSATEDMVCV